MLQKILFLGLNQFSKQAKSHVNEDNGRIRSKMVWWNLLVPAHPADDFLCRRKPCSNQFLRIKAVIFPLFSGADKNGNLPLTPEGFSWQSPSILIPRPC